MTLPTRRPPARPRHDGGAADAPVRAARAGMDMARILSILAATAGQLDFRAVIGAVSTEIADVLPHDHLDVAILSPDGLMVSAYETGLHTEWDAATTATKPVAVSPIRSLFRGEVDHIVTADAQADARFHFEDAFSRAIFAAGLRSRLHVPLVVERRILGALSFSTQVCGTYGEADVAEARIVADILAPYFHALHQSALLKASALQQVEAEARAEGLRIGALRLTEELENARQAIAMDLHDQTLADLSRLLRALQRLGGRSAVAGGDLMPLRDDVERCILELRVLIDRAKPSVLQLFGFADAVEALLERSVGAAPGVVRYEIRGDSGPDLDRLPPAVLVSLYRIVQEAINNAVAHARARRIAVTLDAVAGRHRIAIEDDGCGLPPAAPVRGGGLGTIRTRASLLRADLAVGRGADGTGTRIEILLPAAGWPEASAAAPGEDVP